MSTPDEKAMEEAREALEKKRKMEGEQHHLVDQQGRKNTRPTRGQRGGRGGRAAGARPPGSAAAARGTG